MSSHVSTPSPPTLFLFLFIRRQFGQDGMVYGGLLFFAAGEDSRWQHLAQKYQEVIGATIQDRNFVCHFITARPPMPPFNGQRTVVLHAGWIGDEPLAEAEKKLTAYLKPLLDMEPVINGMAAIPYPKVEDERR